MKSGWIVTMLVMGGGLCLAQSEPPSLADIARKNQAERHHEKVRIVITDDDLASGTSTGPIRPAGSGKGSIVASTGADSSKPDAAVASGNGPQTEQKSEAKKEASGKSATPPPSPKEEVERLKKELDSFKAQQEGWKQSASKYEDKLAVETSEFRRSMYQDALEGDRQNVALFQRKIDDTQSKLTSAENAASKAGAAGQQAGTEGGPSH
jgi:hypothetical protein